LDKGADDDGEDEAGGLQGADHGDDVWQEGRIFKSNQVDE